MESRKNEAACGWCAYQKRLSTVCRLYYVIGLLQPRYVMPNLVAKTTRKKEEWRKKKKKTLYKLL